MEGRVIYVEFPSLDVERAARFWNGVMGWNFGAAVFEKYDYRMAQIAPDAAVAVQPAVEQGPNVYMETPDLEAALERVRELGGTVGQIREIPPLLTAELPSAALHGRFAGCKDSEGNMFHLWQRDPKFSNQGDGLSNPQLALDYLEAVVARDYARVEALLADDFRLRDLSPPGFTEVKDTGQAMSGLRQLLDQFETVRIFESDAYDIGPVTYLRARLHFMHPEKGERMLEQHHLISIVDGHITAIDELCTGFFAA